MYTCCKSNLLSLQHIIKQVLLSAMKFCLLHGSMVLSDRFQFCCHGTCCCNDRVMIILSQEHQTVDPFVIYNPLYSVLRECVSGAVYGKRFQQLTEHTRVTVNICCNM